MVTNNPIVLLTSIRMLR